MATPEIPRRTPYVSDPVQFRHKNRWIAAIVTHVYKNGKVDLAVFPSGMEMLVVREATKGDSNGYWRWPKGVELEN